MAARSEKLNRLVIGTPCSVSREAMQGSGADRFCLTCNKAVYDFEAMTPRQIESRLEANRGRVCARITRSADGRLVTLPSPIPPSSWLERRASPVVSAVVTALLGLGGAAAETTPPASPEASAAPERPAQAPEPDRVSPATAASIDISVQADLEVDLEAQASSIETTGDLVFDLPDNLRDLYTESELVVRGVAGATLGVDPDDPQEVETELRVTSVLKGGRAGKSLFIRHSEGAGWGHLAPGAKVLAFLNVGDLEGKRATYVSADYQSGLKVLSDAEIAAYGERLDALARISRRGEPSPVRLVEWLVATAEDPLTRREATDEIRGALAELAHQAEWDDVSVEVKAAQLRGSADRESSSALLGAYLGEAEKERLRRALLSTRGLSEGDFALFKIVRPWAGDEASLWLNRQFREIEPLQGGVARDVMGYLAEELQSETLTHLLEESDARLEAIVEAMTSEAEWKQVEPLIEAEQRELRDRFRQMLGP